MRKTFTNPQMDILIFTEEDILVTSSIDKTNVTQMRSQMEMTAGESGISITTVDINNFEF